MIIIMHLHLMISLKIDYVTIINHYFMIKFINFIKNHVFIKNLFYKGFLKFVIAFFYLKFQIKLIKVIIKHHFDAQMNLIIELNFINFRH
jgi:hypothetical protein